MQTVARAPALSAGGKGERGRPGSLAVGVSSTLLWMVFSSAVIILNKEVYRRGFPYPSTVTGVGQVRSRPSLRTALAHTGIAYHAMCGCVVGA